MRIQFQTYDEARQAFLAHRAMHEANGVYFSGAASYLPEGFRANHALAMDAIGMAMDASYQPALSTDPNSGVPALLTTFIDPTIYEILFAPNKVAEILGEERKGDWLTETAMFPVVEQVGEVSSYGDFSQNGVVGANTNFPNRQSYLFQSVQNYGERELERAGLARINWVAELNKSAANLMARYLNFTYLFGVAGLQNYGITNDPNLPAALTPAVKANGGVTWFTSGGAPNATANEVYNDIVSLYEALVSANQGLVDKDSKLVLALSPQSEVALTFTNTFNVNVEDLLKKNFKNMRIVSVPQYGQRSTPTSIQGVVGGNLVQLWAEEVEGQKSGFCAFSEKMRSHRIIPDLSSWRQKVTSGTWGVVIRYAVGVQQMIGV